MEQPITEDPSRIGAVRAASGGCATAGCDETVSRFRRAAHDLRQPLHALGLYAGTLRRQAGTSGTRALCDRMEQAVAELSTSLDTLLEFARLQIGAIDPNVARVAIDEVLAVVAAGLAVEADGKGLALCVGPCTGLSADTDARLLERAVWHLARNAVAFTDRGEVTLRAESVSDTIVITIADSGPGTCAGAGGLGLEIVRLTAALLGASFHVDTSPGRGTRASLSLAAPLHRATRADRRDARPCEDDRARIL